jgi:beta-glucosidase
MEKVKMSNFRDRANSIVALMTLREKISQMVHSARGISRLNIPAYNWWNECLHGVGRAGIATVFPQPIGLAAMFDEPFMKEIAETISDEVRAKYNEATSKDDFAVKILKFLPDAVAKILVSRTDLLEP